MLNVKFQESQTASHCDRRRSVLSEFDVAASCSMACGGIWISDQLVERHRMCTNLKLLAGMELDCWHGLYGQERGTSIV